MQQSTTASAEPERLLAAQPTLRVEDIVPACGGTEPISVINGRRWLYCFQPSSGKHCYLDVDNDLITWNRSFHPAFSPELEGTEEELQPLVRREKAAAEVELFYF